MLHSKTISHKIIAFMLSVLLLVTSGGVLALANSAQPLGYSGPGRTTEGESLGLSAMPLGYCVSFDGLGAAPIKITSFEITNKGTGYDGQFYTAKTSLYNLRLELKVSRDGSGNDTTGSVIALEFPDNDYFDWENTEFSGMDALKDLLDFDNMEFDNVDNTLTVPVLSADLNDVTILVDVPFSRDTYGGMLPRGTEMGTIKAYTMAHGGTEPDDEDKEEVEVVSYTKDNRGWGNGAALDTSLILPGIQYTVTFHFGYDSRNSDWYYRDNSTAVIKIYVPEGTTIANATTAINRSAIINPSPIAGQDDYLHRDEDGYYFLWEVDAGHEITKAGGWYGDEGDLARLAITLKLTFPEGADGGTGEIAIRTVAAYYLEGIDELQLNEKVWTGYVSDELEGVMTDSEIGSSTYSSNMPVHVYTRGEVSLQYQVVNNLARNVGAGPLRDVKITLDNDEAVFSRITITRNNSGETNPFPMEYIVTLVDGQTIKGKTTASSSSTLRSIDGIPLQDFGVVSNPEGGTIYPLIEKIEFYPLLQDGETRALQPGASIAISLYYTGNNDIDSVDVQHNLKFTVNWDGQDPDVERVFDRYQFHYVGHEALDLRTSVTNVSPGQLSPGDTATLRIIGHNYLNNSVKGVEWKKPAFFIIVPEKLDWIEEQEPMLYWEATDILASDSPATITDTGKEYNGRKIYRVEFDYLDTPVPQHSSTAGTANKRIYFDLDFTVPPGTSAGNLSVADFAIAIEGATTGNWNTYEMTGLAASVYFEDSVLDLDDNPATTILRKAASQTVPIQKSSAFTVYAELETENGIQKNTSGVYAALQLGRTTGIRLVAENTGNMEIEQFRLYNILPDQTVTTDMGGNAITSLWDGYFAGNLTVSVFDSSGNDISGNFTSNIFYSNSSDPAIDHLDFQRAGAGGGFNAGFDADLNRAFYVALNGTLPAGAKVVVDFGIKTPDTWPAPQVNEVGYNTFVALGKYKGGNNLTPYTSTQEFRITQVADGEISGTVFKDVNGNDIQDSGEDGWQHTGLVELYRDSSGDSSGSWIRVAMADTDADGFYEFTGLFAGDYKLKFLKPSGYTDVVYGNLSDGESLLTTLTYDSSGFGSAGNDAAAVRKGTVNVKFMHGSDQVGVTTTYSDQALGSMMVNASDVGVPANYKLKDDELSIKTAIMSWDEPVVTVVFEVEPVTYTVTFDKNHTDATGYTEADPGEKYVAHGASVGTLPQPPTRTGYEFTGWTMNSDGSGGIFTAGSAVTGNITVYAQWELEELLLSFDANAGEDTVTGVPAAPRTVQYGQPVGDLPGEGTEAEPVRTGYEFLGWSEDRNATTGDFSGAGSITSNTTIYAVWAAQSFNLTVEHYVYGWNENSSDAVLRDTDNETAYYRGSFTATPKEYPGYTFQQGISDSLTVAPVQTAATLKLYYKKDTPYQLQIVECLVLDCDDLYPSFVSNALEWSAFVELLEAKTLDPEGNIVDVAFKTLDNTDYSTLDYGTITLEGTLQSVTVTAEWADGQTDSKTVQVEIVDRVKPIIYLPDDPTFRYTVGGTHPVNEQELLKDFADKGIYTLDNYDGTTELAISYLGLTGFEQIIWNSSNEYIVFLDTVDQSGNRAVQREAVILLIEEEEDGGDDKETPGTDGGDNNNNGGGGSDNPGTDKPDDLDGNGGTDTSTGGSNGGRDRDRSVSVGRDVYLNDQDIPLANELLSIFEEDVPLAELSIFDIPDTGMGSQGIAGLVAGAAALLAALAYKRED